MALLAEPVLKKQYRSLTSKEKIKTVLKDDLVKHISESYIMDLVTDLQTSFDSWNKNGGKRDRLKEEIASAISKRKNFKYTQGVLDQMVELLMEQALSLKVEPLDITKSEEYQEFLSYSLEDTARILSNGLTTDFNCWALYFIQGKSRALATPLIQLSDQFLWVPSLPSEGILEDGTNFTRSDIFRFFQPIIDEGFAAKKDRGSVEGIGPRGGRFLVGEVYSSVPRAELKDKDKKIPLANDYSLELFVTQAPPVKK